MGGCDQVQLQTYLELQNTHTHTHTHLCVWRQYLTYKPADTHKHTHPHTHTHTHTNLCVWRQDLTNKPADTHKHTHTHTHTHTNTHKKQFPTESTSALPFLVKKSSFVSYFYDLIFPDFQNILIKKFMSTVSALLFHPYILPRLCDFCMFLYSLLDYISVSPYCALSYLLSHLSA